MHDAARSARKDVIVLCHGGPIAEPEDAEYVLAHTEGVAGFFGASSIERLATESGHRGAGAPVPRHEDAAPAPEARSKAMTAPHDL